MHPAVVDVNGSLLCAAELVYEQCRSEVRGRWREQVEPYLSLHTNTRPDLGDWARPWLELKVVSVPTIYAHAREDFTDGGSGSQEPGMLHDRPDARLVAMDEAGVDVVVLHPSSFGGQAAALPDTGLGCGLLSGFNRYLGTYCLRDPTRLRGAIQLHGDQPEWSVTEIRRLARRSWVAGASLSLPPDVPVWDARLAPVLAALEEAGLPLFHHSHILDAPGFPGREDLWSDPGLAAVLGSAWDAQRQLTALVVGGVLDRHPRLRVCVLDGGVGWVPEWLERLDHVSDAAGDAARTMLRLGRTTLAIAPHESEQAVTAVAEIVGERCLAWGSAFPRAGRLGPARPPQWRSMSESRAALILGANALSLLDALPSHPIEHEEVAP